MLFEWLRILLNVYPCNATGTGLECYYCDESNSEMCNSNEAGEIVKCQMAAPEGPHYGDSCSVGHTGTFNV